MADAQSIYLTQINENYRERIEHQLLAYCQFGDGCPDILAEAICYSLLAPGKRLRPILVLMAAEMCGTEWQRAMPAACAVEMVHAYSLIHDDLPAMDDDDLRRGRPTCHLVYGEANAILAGDALLTRAFEVLAADLRPAAVAAACCVELARAAGAAGMVGGQADDLRAEQGELIHDVKLLESVHLRKTGAMLRVALRMGGIVAGADATQLENLDEYGKSLGLAFQIVDDLLDHGGDEQQLGKRAGKDSGRGKMTFPGLLGVEASRIRARTLIQQARDAIRSFGDSAGGLEALAQFVLERKK